MLLRLVVAGCLPALMVEAQPYTLLIKGGTVVDPKNRRNGRFDVAIRLHRI